MPMLLPALSLQIGPQNPSFDVKRKLEIELKNPNIVIGPTGSIGTWTTIYDEGFEVSLDDWKVREGEGRAGGA